MTETVFVGMSGGVDSSVAALRLLKRGYTVIGVFIKVWQPDFIQCEWEKERLDAMRVAAHLGIPFLTFDAEAVYKKEVADYMIRAYEEGYTPNPDVMCNEHVKFGAFYDWARAHGADKVATGHYAQVEVTGDVPHLLRGVDAEKDQSYFLWRLSPEVLAHVLFPVGDTCKANIRREAEAARIPTFAKADSQGVCFLGEINMKEFLSHYIELHEGDVITTDGERIGTHSGALLYTLGERHGFTTTHRGTHNVPHYVVARNILENTITVATTPPHTNPNTQVTLTDIHKIGRGFDRTMEAQFRYRQKPITVTVQSDEPQSVILTSANTSMPVPMRGQSCVLYRGNECCGGGVIT